MPEQINTRCAVCRLSDGLVLNVIIALPSDLAPDECQLIEIMNGQMCDVGWYWNGVDFTPPPDPVV